MSATADVVSVGGGVTGALVAVHLAAVGVRDVGLLERALLAAGTSRRSVAIILRLDPNPETTRMAARSLRVFQTFSDAVGAESGYVACGGLVGVSPAMRGGFWVAAGIHGFKLAVGEMMAALITGASSLVDAGPFCWSRFPACATSGIFVASYLR